MLFVAQIALGVCLGMLLFRFLAVSLPAFARRSNFTIHGAFWVAGAFYVVLMVLHLVLNILAPPTP